MSHELMQFINTFFTVTQPSTTTKKKGLKKSNLGMLWESLPRVIFWCVRNILITWWLSRWQCWSSYVQQKQEICDLSYILNQKQEIISQTLQHPYISMHILQTVLYTFPKVLTRRICLSIKRFFGWWSLSSYFWPKCMIQRWSCEKLEASHY